MIKIKHTLRRIFLVVICGSANVFADCMVWERLNLDVQFEARDSAGSVYFNNNAVIIGGWKSSDILNLQSIFLINQDGTTVNSVAPDIKNADLPVSLVFRNKIYIISGWQDGRLDTARATSSIHVSEDGLNYKYLGEGNFTPRVGAGGVVFKDQIYIIGGTKDYHHGDDASYLNDVWVSNDGLHYSLVSEHANFPPRAFHQVFVFKEKLCVAGGGGYKPKAFTLNDIWCSENGINFYSVTPNADWEPRIWFGSFVHDGKAYILGGDNLRQDGELSVNKTLNDVWVSNDLSAWKHLPFKAIWSPRHAFSTVYAENQNKVYVIAGHAHPLSNEVWSWAIPGNVKDIKDFGKCQDIK